jgi:hypothetical protein
MKKENRIIVYAGVSAILLFGVRHTESAIAKDIQLAAFCVVLILIIWELFQRVKSSKNIDRWKVGRL